MIDVERLRAEEDALSRARQASAMQEELQTIGLELSRIRREAIEDLMRQGLSQTAIAAELGMSRARIGQLVASGPPPERLFFGDQTLIVPLGGKYEAGKEKPGLALANEDLQTFTRLTDLLGDLQLKAVHELVTPPGIINLNRDNLFVICGPRLSPIISLILESDPYLGFGQDESGWYLVDKKKGIDFRSPQDEGESGDVAYFGRLPRPDGKGFFLYTAGIHAAGAKGVIHYLENSLTSFYKNVKTQRFSVLIECSYDEESGEVSDSKLITDIYKHESPS